MPLRLSELLERIRPVGAPGAASDASPQRELVAIEETADVARLLADFEAEADAVIEAGRAHADAIRSDAERRAGQLRADLADRVAAATADAGTVDSDVAEALDEVRAETDAAVHRLRADADVDRVVARAVETIWASVPEEVGP